MIYIWYKHFINNMLYILESLQIYWKNVEQSDWSPWLDLRTRLRWTIERDLPYCKLKVIFKSKCRHNTLFLFKDSPEKKICSGIIYHYTCNSCKVTYYGKTFHHFCTRVAEHMGISNLKGKCLKNVKQSAISDHLLQCNCAINFDDFSILAMDSNKIKWLLSKSLLIKYYKPILKLVSAIFLSSFYFFTKW